MGGEADVVGRRHYHPGHGAALEAAHSIAQHRPGDTAEGLEAGGQGGEGGVGALVVGEDHEPEPAPGRHRAEHEQGADLAPVDDEHVARRPHAGTPPPVVVRPPQALGLGHQAAQVAGRALVAGGPDRRQQPLGRDQPLRLLDPLGHDVGDDVVVVRRRRIGAGGRRPRRPAPPVARSWPWCRRARLRPGRSPPLGRRRSCPCVPSLISLERPLVGAVLGRHRHRHRPGDFSGGCFSEGWGLLLATSEDFSWPPAGTSSGRQ